jgi:hypothetical protein
MTAAETPQARDLWDILAVEDLVKSYCYIVDDAEWERLAEVFTVDATCDFTPMFGFIPVMRSLDEIIAVFRDEIEHPMAHYVTNIMVSELTGDRAVVRSKIITMTRGKQPMAGEYRDVAVRTPQGWRLRHREAHRPRKLTEHLRAGSE